jgi:glycosyltransferase involved in cell wall biosynthesis
MGALLSLCTLRSHGTLPISILRFLGELKRAPARTPNPSRPVFAVNIVVVNDFAYVNGGAGKVALGSALALARLGHKVTLFTAVGPIASELKNVPGLETICLGQREIVDNPNRGQAIRQGLWNVSADARFRVLLAGLSRDQTIIHFHGWTKALSSSVVRVAVSLGFQIVLTLHDYFGACPAGTFYNHRRQEICHLRPMSAGCISSNCDSRNYGHKLWRVGRQWIQSHFGLLPSGVHEYIAISDLSVEILKPFLPRASRIHRVRNFIDIEPMPAVKVESNQLFSFSGRLSAEKGPLLLAECSRDAMIETLFIGDGPLRRRIEETSPYASCTGWLPAIDAIAQLRRSRALVFPSLWYEGQPLVVAEAAAMGIPAIVPDTCAAKEQVTDGVTGLWFRGGDSNNLKEKMKYLRDNPSVAREMGREAFRRYWQSPATLDAHCQSLQQVYESTLAPSV